MTMEEKFSSIIDENNKVVIDSQGIISEELADLFRLYEFSDKVILMEHINYPGIDNYVKTGVISKEEMIRSLEIRF
ncbi:hypothetical protein [Eubacterium xylanophilum]|uniref:hypothetical protein n=1 Tax=Eubacterium xylanophilum TaxID=39497 RepID=UPI00047B8D77|nr:hypothetical protein [Eubacterium xylanophilum]